MLLLKKNIIKKRQRDKNVIKLNTSKNNSSEYKVKAICDIAVYIRKLAGHLIDVYYLVF